MLLCCLEMASGGTRHDSAAMTRFYISTGESFHNLPWNVLDATSTDVLQTLPCSTMLCEDIQRA